MARLIETDLMVELEWETLLGFDKEARELRDLCHRRRANRHAVFSDEQGLRTAGLVAKDSEPNAARPGGAPVFSLAAIVSKRAAGQTLVFLHTLDEPDSGQLDAAAPLAILIAIKAGRPEIDRVLPLPEAAREAQLFIESLSGKVALFGNYSLDDHMAEAMPLPVAIELSDTERDAALIVPLGSRVRSAGGRFGARSGTARLSLPTAILIGLIAIGGGAFTWMLWPDSPPPITASTAAAPVDPLVQYQSDVKQRLSTELQAPSHQDVAQIQLLLVGTPLEVAGWRAQQLQCEARQCTVVWIRGKGGTLSGLLLERPGTVVREDNFDQAHEIIHLEADETLSPITLRKRKTFFDIAGARTSKLRDYGMQAQIGAPVPLIPPPATVVPAASGASGAQIVAKGPWTMAGHLAFIDSVAGLMKRTGNMSLKELIIDTDPAKPRFNASGEFYVE